LTGIVTVHDFTGKRTLICGRIWSCVANGLLCVHTNLRSSI